jgi:hypothetical protein
MNTATALERVKQAVARYPSQSAAAEAFGMPYEVDERWIELDRIGYKPNRMVAYPSGVFAGPA